MCEKQPQSAKPNKKKLNLPLKYLSEHMSSPAGDSKYEVERHRMCRESEALMDECLSVLHILNCKMEKERIRSDSTSKKLPWPLGKRVLNQKALRSNSAHRFSL